MRTEHCLVWLFGVAVWCGCLVWLFGVAVAVVVWCGCLVWLFGVAVWYCCRCLVWQFGAAVTLLYYYVSTTKWGFYAKLPRTAEVAINGSTNSHQQLVWQCTCNTTTTGGSASKGRACTGLGVTSRANRFQRTITASRYRSTITTVINRSWDTQAAIKSSMQERLKHFDSLRASENSYQSNQSPIQALPSILNEDIPCTRLASIDATTPSSAGESPWEDDNQLEVS